MKDWSNFVTLILLLGVAFFALPSPALAYMDPGAGSYVIQVLIAGLLGATFTLKVFWRNIRTFLSGLRPRKGQLGRGNRDAS